MNAVEVPRTKPATCTATRADGSPCRSLGLLSGRCYTHSPEISESERHATRTRGGKGRSRSARAHRLMPERLRPLFTMITTAMAEVKRGEITPAQGSALASLAGAAVKLQMAGEVESRLRALEASQDDATEGADHVV